MSYFPISQRGREPLLLVLLAALGASFLTRAHLASREESVAGKMAAAPSGLRSPASPRSATLSPDTKLPEPLLDFLGVEDLADVPRALEGFLPDDARDALKCVIVCVPNPVDSVVGYRFDTVVDTLQKALAKDGYVLDRYALPWTAPIASSDEPQHDSVAAKRNWADGEPGILLLRRNEQLALVYLVAETPTSGIDKSAFMKCVKDILVWQKLFDSPATPLPIVGPNFSGSAQSLTGALRDCLSDENLKPEGSPKFRLISGSANNIDPKRLLSRLPDEQAVSVHFTSIHVDLLKEALLRFIRDQHLPGPAPRIAWLTESNTGYGNSASAKASIPKLRYTVFPFPLHISRVRASYERNMLEKANQRPHLGDERFHQPIPFDDPYVARDTLPEFAPLMTAAVADMTLDRILTTIRRDRYAYVGITATDVRDKLFLAAKLRSRCPDVHLVLVGADLAYLQPLHRADLAGSLVASAYPLFAGNQYWSFPFHLSPWAFSMPSSPDQGTFNAIAFCLHPELLVASDGVPDAVPLDDLPQAANLLEYGSPVTVDANGDRPPIWISMVGRDTMWPVAVRAAGPLACKLAKSANARQSVSNYDDAVARVVPVTTTERRGVDAVTGKRGNPLNLQYQAADYLGVLGLAAYAIVFSAVYFRRPSIWIGEYLARLSDKAAPIDAATYQLVAPAGLYLPLAWSSFIAEAPLVTNPLARETTLKSEELSKTFYFELLGQHVTAYLLAGWICVTLTRAIGKPRTFRGVAQRVLAILAPAIVWLIWSGATLPRLLLVWIAVASIWLGAAVWDGVLRIARKPKSPFACVLLAAVSQALALLAVFVGQYRYQRADAWRDWVFLFERTSHLGGGASLLVPLALLGAAMHVWALYGLRRVWLVEAHSVPAPWPEDASDRLGKSDHQTRTALQGFPWEGLADDPSGRKELAWLTLIMLFSISWLGLIIWRAVPTVEGPVLSMLVWSGICSVLVVLVLWWWRAVRIARAVSRFYRELASKPLLDAYERIPARAAGAIKRFPWSRRTTHETLRMANAWLAQLNRDYRQDLGLGWADLALPAPAAENDPKFNSAARLAVTQASRMLWPRLCADWDAEHVSRRFSRSADDEAEPQAERGESGAAWRMLVEEFMAILTIEYVSQFFSQWWNLIRGLLTAPLLLLLAVASYPFQPQQLLIGTIIGIIAIVTVTLVVVEVDWEENELLSRMMGRRPNRVDWDSQFILTLLAWVLPLALVLFAQIFPEAWNWFGGLFDSLAKSLG